MALLPEGPCACAASWATRTITEANPASRHQRHPAATLVTEPPDAPRFGVVDPPAERGLRGMPARFSRARAATFPFQRNESEVAQAPPFH